MSGITLKGIISGVLPAVMSVIAVIIIRRRRRGVSLDPAL